jgi:mannan endo-1,6-alpha-mannosidase
MEAVQFIGGRPYGTPGYSVFDGASTGSNCTDRDPVQWTYTAGMLLNACAVMWNATQDSTWETRALGIWNASLVFFPNNQKIMVEVACTYNHNCDLDQQSFKTFFARFMAASTKWMPQLSDTVMPYIQASAQAAAEQCSGTVDQYQGDICGLNWAEKSRFDGNYGPGQQMAALEVIQANLISQAGFPLTAKTGGISKGNPSAGSSGDTTTGAPPLQTITTGDKAGAGVLTAVVLCIFLGGTWWIIV